MKFIKNAKNKLKLKEKAEILAQENFQKRGNQLKRGTLTPLIRGCKGHPILCFKWLVLSQFDTSCHVIMVISIASTTWKKKKKNM